MHQGSSASKRRRVSVRGALSLLGVTVAGAVLAFGSTGCPLPDRAPPGPVKGFAAVEGDTQVELSWTNPTDSDLVGVRIVRKEGGAPSSPSDGTVVFEVYVQLSSAQTFTDTQLTNGTTYFYGAWAFDEVPNYSSPAQLSATPTATTAVLDILEEYDGLSRLLDQLPTAILDESSKQVLMGLLQESESHYRKGDPCASSDALSEYQAKAQEFRPAAGGQASDETLAALDELYNSGRMIRYNLLLSMPGGNPCPGHERVGREVEAEVLEEDNTKVYSAFEFGEPKLTTVKVDEGVFTQLHVPGAEANDGQPGLPAVPIARQLIAVPKGADVVLRSDARMAETAIKMNLVPYQPQPVDQVDPDLVPPDPSVFANPPFEIDRAFYDSDQVFPPEVATLTEIGDLRDLRVFLLEVTSAQYNPASDLLQLYDRVSVNVDFQGGEGTFLTAASTHAFESNKSLYQQAVLNHTSVGLHIDPTIVAKLIGEEFLILTHPDFREAADKLADWKRSIGWVTSVFECGTGSGIATRDTAAEIDAFIKDRYDSTIIRPSYILLLGDAEFIPTFYSGGIGTDWPYAILGVREVDRCPDFGLGRIPVDTLAQANAVVDKIIAYEDHPPNNMNFYNRAAIAAQFQCCRNDVGQAGTDQRTFAEVSEFARNVMTSKGKTVDRIYTRTIDGSYGGDPTPRRYYDGTLLPAGINPASGFPWNGNTANITAAINEGRFLVIHRDHGWEGGWANPLFNNSHADALTNGALRPVVFSVNCASGFFDNETAGGAYGTTVNGVYFAERLIRDPDHGAVGVLGDTRNSPSWPNTALTKGFIDAIWPDALPYGSNTAKPRLGDILNHGKLYMMTQIGVAGAGVSSSSADDELKLWHVFGDPTMKIYRAYPYVVTLPVEVITQLLAQTIQIDYPVEGAEVTLYQNAKDGSVIPIARGTVEGGTALLDYFEAPDRQAPLFAAVSLEDAIPIAAQVTLVTP
jgi:hypothetical protein